MDSNSLIGKSAVSMQANDLYETHGSTWYRRISWYKDLENHIKTDINDIASTSR